MVAWEKKNAHKLASEEKKRMEKELEKLKERMLQKKEYFLQALQDLPLARAYLEEPGELLLAELFKLQDIARRLMDIRQEIKQLREESSRFEEEVKKAALELGFEAAPDPLETVFSLKKSLEKAAEKQWHCRQGQKELEELERALHKLKAEKQTMEKNLLYINNTFSAWGEGDVEKGIELYLNQEKARQGAEELQKHLEREYPDLDLLAGEIKETSSSADSWLFSDGELAKAEVELQELEEKLRQLAEEEAALRRELEILESSMSPSELVGKGEMLEEQMKEAVYSRDKLALAASIIREADRSYRQEHQPDVLLRCR
ncbi:MAG TPA: hypothetical protein PKI30_10390, partial [Bacillota bacterium]|nr:hypothetical protein [Bacillota bacterium]